MTQTQDVRQHGPAIRALRRKDGLSVAALAARVGLHPQSLRNIELNNKPASPETLNAIARALVVDVAAVSHPSGDAPQDDDFDEAALSALDALDAGDGRPHGSGDQQ